MIFAKPIRLPLHENSWKRPAGNTDGRVTQPFGCTGLLAERRFGDCAHFHRAIDIGNGRCGADVLAAGDGTVHRAGPFSDGAIVVEINHGGGWFTAYTHLATEVVSRGDKVVKGQKIGTIGKTGNASACHLHFAVKAGVDASVDASMLGDKNGKWQDPWPRLEQNVTADQNITARPKQLAKIRIRSSAGSGTTLGPIFAETSEDGFIIRSDGVSLGSVTDARKWGGTIKGATYTLDGTPGDTWERLFIDGDFRFVASPLVIRSIP